MSNNIDKFVNEEFVNELMKSGVWDIARVGAEGQFNREEKELNEALLSESGKGRTGASRGDKGKDPRDPKAIDYSDEGDREGDESETHPGEEDYEGDDDKGDDENGNGKKKKKQEEGFTARDLAEHLFDNLNEDIIVEFIDLLYTSVLNEEALAEAEAEAEEGEYIEEDNEEDSE
jgi:hypothetical protein